jgi:hypothetical protein
MAAGGSSANVHLGPGRLYYAPIGTAEPTSASAALPSAWEVLGYTEDGTTVETEISNEGIEVAEELDPVLYVMTRRMTKLSVKAAEATVTRLALALGAGASRADDTTVFEFPAPSAIVPVMIVWDSAESPTDANNRRWIFRECHTSGTVAIQRQKAPNKALVPITLNCALPTGQTSPVRVFPGPSGRI